MELQGSVTIAAPPDLVWQALNDPQVLRKCIPGCEEVRQISPHEMHARVMLKLGPVRANFVGKILLTDVRAPLGCTLNFEGSGGSAGFAKGSSVIALTPVAAGTQVEYTAQASVAGKLGQIGGRLMDASARQMADRFFAAFKAEVSGAADYRGDSVAVPVDNNPGTVQAARVAATSLPSRELLSPLNDHWFTKEKPRLLWFVAGVVSTAAGVWMGAHWLR